VTAFFFAYQDEMRIFNWLYLTLIPMTLWSLRGDSSRNLEDVRSAESSDPKGLSGEETRPVTVLLAAISEEKKEG
jgi:hypothetical protein